MRRWSFPNWTCPTPASRKHELGQECSDSEHNLPTQLWKAEKTGIYEEENEGVNDGCSLEKHQWNLPRTP